MTPAELIPIIRDTYLDEQLDEEDCEEVQEDSAKNKTGFLLREINRAQRQACWRGDMKRIRDNATVAIARITLVGEQGSYPLDKRILRIDSITLDSFKLYHTSRAKLDDYRCDWRHRSADLPREFFIQGRTLHLLPVPSHAEDGEQLHLDVWREPLRDARMRDQIEIEDDPEALGHWVAHRALLRPNYDKGDPNLAQYHLAEFNNYYGMPVPKSARDDLLAMPDNLNFGRGERQYAHEYGTSYCRPFSRSCYYGDY